MKKTILAIVLMIALAITTSSKAQVGIGVSTANINPLAQLDVVSTTKGFLPPRMNEAQRNAIVNASAGLIIYCTDCGSNGGEPECYSGSAWVSMIGLQGSLTTLAPTISITAIGIISATCGGNILADGGVSVYFRGVCWSTSSNPTIALSTKTIDGTGIGSFTSSITGLTDNTTYYVRSYATNAAGTAYGNELAFTSLPLSSTSSISNLMATTATCGGNISAGGNATITARGVCWSTSSNPTIALSTKTSDGTGTGSFTSSITGLTEITTYYVRSYVTNAIGTAYGNEVVFTSATIPFLSTSSVSNLMATTATCGGNISADGNATITLRGVCWSTSSNPTIALSTKTSNGTGIGSFTSSITGLTENTTYHVRSYATNAVGTAYGNEVVFTSATIPSLSTSSVSNLMAPTATCGGNISADGNATVTARGVCWSTNSNPTIALSTKTLDGTGIGSFTSSITGLTQNTTYYVRSYATNAVGTAYGNEVVFTTLLLSVPTISTSSISNLMATTTTCGGNISADGNATVTARGVCWSTNSNPTIALSTKTFDGTGIGSFTSSITGLTDNTTYYVRSYATNAGGTVYGNEVVFTSLPIISTSSISMLLPTDATCGGNISANGNAIITARGVCWSRSSNPTIALSTKTVDGIGIGSFTSSITRLYDNATHYVRSYATNAGGTAYGNEVVFTTSSIGTIGTQRWTTQNLNVSTYRDGTPIPEVASNKWSGLTTGAWCYYDDDPVNGYAYGKLYNWYAVNDSIHGGLAPLDWHIPSDSEWTTLETYLGGSTVAGYKMKEAGYEHWFYGNDGSNSSSFAGLPGGYLESNSFYDKINSGSWWSSTQNINGFAWYRIMYYSSGNVFRGSSTKTHGFSVRCIRD